MLDLQLQRMAGLDPIGLPEIAPLVERIGEMCQFLSTLLVFFLPLNGAGTLASNSNVQRLIPKLHRWQSENPGTLVADTAGRGVQILTPTFVDQMLMGATYRAIKSTLQKGVESCNLASYNVGRRQNEQGTELMQCSR